MIDHTEAAKVAGDVASWGLIVGTLFQYLPQIAAGLSILWTLYRFGESIYDRRFKQLK